MLPFLASSFSPTSTPSTTFHHLLSAGTFQPVRSLALNIDGSSSFASAAPIKRAEERTSNRATRNRFIASPGELFTFDFVIRISRVNRRHFPGGRIAAMNVNAIFKRDGLIRLERVLLKHEGVGRKQAVVADVPIGGKSIAARMIHEANAHRLAIDHAIIVRPRRRLFALGPF